MTESGNGTEGIAESGTGIVAGIVKTFGDGPAGGSSAGRSAVVTARGTADGLVLRVESSVSRDALRKGLWDFMESRRNFIAGNELIIEWTHDKPEDAFIVSLQAELATEFEVTFKDPLGKDLGTARAEISESGASKPKVPSLFDGIEALGINPGISGAGSSGATGLSGGASSSVGFDRGVERANERSGRSAQPAAVWDEADTHIIYGTLRSGQKVETEHSLVVVGDVNSGAEIVAGGDVIVLGCLRGIAHAGAYDESGGGRTIFALNLQPTQLRIGGVITRGGASEGYAGPELARVDGAMIIVEAYQSRGMNQGKGSAKRN